MGVDCTACNYNIFQPINEPSARFVAEFKKEHQNAIGDDKARISVTVILFSFLFVVIFYCDEGMQRLLASGIVCACCVICKDKA